MARLEKSMKIEVGEDDPVRLKTEEQVTHYQINGEVLTLYMRDGGFELSYGGDVWSLKGDTVNLIYSEKRLKYTGFPLKVFLGVIVITILLWQMVYVMIFGCEF